MKKIIVAAGLATTLLASTSAATEFLYGACRPVKDTEFYECLSLDMQSVYTNQLPSVENLRRFSDSIRVLWRAELARRLRIKKHERHPEMPASEPEQVALREAELCASNHVEVRRLIDRWSLLQLTLGVPGDQMREKEMDALETQIGALVNALCAKSPEMGKGK